MSMVAAAEAAGKLHPATKDRAAAGIIVEGTGGNTGLALALVARSAGYRCILTVPDRITEEKKASMRLFGAELVECPSVPFSDPRHFYHEASRIAAKTPGAVWTDQFQNAANWQAHFGGTGPEILAQTGGDVDAIALASGTGGTIGGLSAFFAEAKPGVKMVLVDPPGSSLKGLLETGQFRALPGSTITEGIGTGRHTLGFDVAQPLISSALAVRDEDAVQMAHFLLSQEGVFVGPAAAMNVVGAFLTARQLGPGHTVVTILCDGGDRYRSTIYNDEYLLRKGLAEVAHAGARGSLPDAEEALRFSKTHPSPRAA